MTRSGAIEWRLCERTDVYAAYLGGVSSLFSSVFKRPFPAAGWRQWYLENPYGSPLACIGLSAGQVVAHHALVPQALSSSKGRRCEYRLSMSTMVHPECRGLRFFMHMVEALHAAAKAAGAGFVLAFPNSNSAPLFEKLYGYRPIVHTELCNWTPRCRVTAGSEWTESRWEAGATLQHSSPADSAYWSWRIRNNQARSCAVGGALQLIYKVIDSATLMVLDAYVTDSRNAVEHLAHIAHAMGRPEVRLTRYHAALLGIPDADLTPHEGYVVRLFGFPLAEEVPDIRFSLLLSDVF